MDKESGKILNPLTNRLVSATGRIGKQLVSTTAARSSASSSKSTSPIPYLPPDILRKILNNDSNNDPKTIRAFHTATKHFSDLLSKTGKENGKYLSQYFKSLITSKPIPEDMKLYMTELILIPTPESKLPKIFLGYKQWNSRYTKLFPSFMTNKKYEVFMSHKNLKKQPIIKTNNAGQFLVLSSDADEINKELSDVLDNLSKVEIVHGNKQNSIIEEWNKSLITNSKKS
jgi:hypothetical protein